jgi:hypothetical protein
LPLPDGSELEVLRAPGHPVLLRGSGGAAIPEDAGLRPVVRFGDGIALLAWEVVPADDGFQVDLVWRCLAELKEDYRVFVHVIDPARGPYAAADHVLGRRRYPSSSWQVGDVIEEGEWIPLTIPEGHQVYLGVYGAAPGSRLPLTGADPSWTAEPNAIRIY